MSDDDTPYEEAPVASRRSSAFSGSLAPHFRVYDGPIDPTDDAESEEEEYNQEEGSEEEDEDGYKKEDEESDGDGSSTDKSVEFETSARYNEVFDDLVGSSVHQFTGSAGPDSQAKKETTVEYVVDLRIENNEIRIGGSYAPINFRDIAVRRVKRVIPPFKVVCFDQIQK